MYIIIITRHSEFRNRHDSPCQIWVDISITAYLHIHQQTRETVVSWCSKYLQIQIAF